MTIFTPQEKKSLTKLLGCAVNCDEVLTLNGLHGYLYGLAINPEPIFPSEWLPGIFGEEMMEFKSEEEGGQLMGCLFAAYNRMSQQSQDGELSFPFDIRKMKVHDIPHVREWAHGLFLATSQTPELWGMCDDEDFDDGEYEPFEDDLKLGDADDDIIAKFGDEEHFLDEDGEIATCFAIVMGVAFPERIPDLFGLNGQNPLSQDWDDPRLANRLYELLPDAVAGLQEYADAYRDDMRKIFPDYLRETRG